MDDPQGRWAALGWADPVPGDLGQVQSVLSGLRSTSQTLDDEVGRLRGLGITDDGVAEIWTGPTASKFAQSQSDLLKRLTDAQTVFSDAVSALSVWSSQLAEAQNSAEALLEQAEEAQSLPNDQGRAQLTALGLQRDSLAGCATQYAQDCASALDAAVALVNSYRPHTSWWSDVVHFVESGVNDVMGFLSSLSSVLDQVNKWLAVAALLTAPFPVLGEVVDAVSLISAATEMGADLVLLAGGRKSLGDVALDGAGLAANFVGDGVGEALAKSGMKDVSEAAEAGAKDVKTTAEEGGGEVKAATEGTSGAAKEPATKEPSVFHSAAHSTAHPFQRISESAHEVSRDGYKPTVKNWLDPHNPKVVVGRGLQMSARGYDFGMSWFGPGTGSPPVGSSSVSTGPGPSQEQGQ